MPSVYLQSGEYAAYGVPATAGPQVASAAALIDAYLKRPEGLVWTPDAVGNPCFMAAMTADATLTAPGAIAAGSNVAVPVTGPLASVQLGDALILDRANPAKTEAVVVNALTPGVSLGLASVANAHSAGALLEHGLVISEKRFIPQNRPLTLLGRTPVARIVSGVGRYGYGRRGDMGASNINDFNLLAALNRFGGPPVWEVFSPAITDFNPPTGELWIPAGVMLAYYTEIKVGYVAGWAYAALPSQIKQAAASIALALINAPELGAVKSYKAGDTAIERFADTNISGDVRAMIDMFRANVIA